MAAVPSLVWSRRRRRRRRGRFQIDLGLLHGCSFPVATLSRWQRLAHLSA